MLLEITGRHIEVPHFEKDRLRERVGKLERYAGPIDEARLIVTGEKHRVSAEAIITSGRVTWKAKEEDTDLSSALTSVVEKIEAQARKNRARRRNHKGQASARRELNEWTVEVFSREAMKKQPGSVDIVKTTKIPIRPMSAEEAALELDGSMHDFIVFRDAASERVSVLYKRRDGHFGLISPEW